MSRVCVTGANWWWDWTATTASDISTQGGLDTYYETSLTKQIQRHCSRSLGRADSSQGSTADLYIERDRHRITGRQGIDERPAGEHEQGVRHRSCRVHRVLAHQEAPRERLHRPRDPEEPRDQKKTGLLRGLPGATERLVLFEADIYDAASFEPAIQGCEFVFLVATPLQHNSGSSKYKDTTEAIEDTTRAILQQCERSNTVRRVISTGSVITASPLREDGEGYKEFVNESCWTPLGLPIDHNNEFMEEYLSSKCIAEKELVKYNDRPSEGRAFDVVVLLLGLVGGDTLLPYINESQHFMLSPFTGIEPYHNALRFTQAVLGAVPVVHVDDVCEAHVFCMERQRDVAAGRYLCATAHTNMQDLVEHYAGKHPELKLARKEVVGEGVRVQADTNKLVELGFKFKYRTEDVLDGSVDCGKRLGLLSVAE